MVGGMGGSAKSDFISKEALIKHLMRGGGGVKKGKKSSDVIYGQPPRDALGYAGHLKIRKIFNFAICMIKKPLFSLTSCMFLRLALEHQGRIGRIGCWTGSRYKMGNK